MTAGLELRRSSFSLFQSGILASPPEVFFLFLVEEGRKPLLHHLESS